MTTRDKFFYIAGISDGFITWNERMDLMINLMRSDPVGFVEAARGWKRS